MFGCIGGFGSIQYNENHNFMYIQLANAYFYLTGCAIFSNSIKAEQSVRKAVPVRRPPPDFMNYKNLVLTIFLLMLLQACGQSGPLYLPGNPPPIYVPK